MVKFIREVSKENKTLQASLDKISIKREIIKKKAIIIARNSKGQFIARRRAIKGFTLSKAKSLFKTNRTFNERVIKTRLAKVIEIEDFRDRPMRPRKNQSMRIQYFVRFKIPGRNIITARSLQHNVNFSKKKMKEEALENAYGVLAQEFGLSDSSGDSEAGKEKFNELEGAIKVDEGFVYYVSI